jgi:hypothetical protein
VRKRYGDVEVLRGVDLDCSGEQRHQPDRRLGLRQVEQLFGSPREERTQGFLKRIVEAGRAADVATGA